MAEQERTSRQSSNCFISDYSRGVIKSRSPILAATAISTVSSVEDSNIKDRTPCASSSGELRGLDPGLILGEFVTNDFDLGRSRNAESDTITAAIQNGNRGSPSDRNGLLLLA